MPLCRIRPGPVALEAHRCQIRRLKSLLNIVMCTMLPTFRPIFGHRRYHWRLIPLTTGYAPRCPPTAIKARRRWNQVEKSNVRVEDRKKLPSFKPSSDQPCDPRLHRHVGRFTSSPATRPVFTPPPSSLRITGKGCANLGDFIYLENFLFKSFWATPTSGGLGPRTNREFEIAHAHAISFVVALGRWVRVCL